ncbi:MAG: glycosyltransferase [Deltaproteobacteria bacterium]|nr:glycosyltransferase [Deltaproteobacteria bacterium]
MHILSWPRPYPANPYLTRLTEAFARQGVSSRSHRYLAALALRPTRAPWLHLHWPEWMLRDPHRARAWARAAWFFGLIDAARARGVRLAWTAHNLLGHDEPHYDLALRFRSAFVRRCAVIHGHFEHAETDVRAMGFRGTFVYAGHPHACDDYHPTATREVIRASLGFGSQQRVMLCFGSMQTYKGFDRVARSFVASAGPADRLLIAGSTPDPNALRAILDARNGDPRITIREGFLTREQSADLVMAADVMVLGYRAFYTSGTAMLALSMGTPLVGPPIHHLAAMRDEPFFAPFSEPSDLMRAVARVTTSRASARESAQAWARRFTYDALATSLRDALAHCGEA